MIDKRQVQHIAKLARLNLTEPELHKFQKDLSAILDFVEQLNQAETSGIEPMRQVSGLCNVMREDEAKEPDKDFREKFLNNAPETKEGYVKVKAIFGE